MPPIKTDLTREKRQTPLPSGVEGRQLKDTSPWRRWHRGKGGFGAPFGKRASISHTGSAYLRGSLRAGGKLAGKKKKLREGGEVWWGGFREAEDEDAGHCGKRPVGAGGAEPRAKKDQAGSGEKGGGYQEEARVALLFGEIAKRR